MTNKVKITLVRSTIGRKFNQKRTVVALGIKKLNQTVTHNNTPQIQGMISKVRHLVKVEEISG